VLLKERIRICGAIMDQWQGAHDMDWKLEVVVVPVSDVDRAKRFYSEQLGFVVDTDTTMSETFRVVQLTPPGSACSVIIGTGLTGMAPGSLEGLQLTVPDIQTARQELVARGVEVGPIQHFENGVALEGPGGDYNSFIFFKDPDGNNWAVQEHIAGG
jgi:catechol 2,3-dioxygenase-like lactoylglutathione lyase family enzyme